MLDLFSSLDGKRRCCGGCGEAEVQRCAAPPASLPAPLHLCSFFHIGFSNPPPLSRIINTMGVSLECGELYPTLQDRVIRQIREALERRSDPVRDQVLVIVPTRAMRSGIITSVFHGKFNRFLRLEFNVDQSSCNQNCSRYDAVTKDSRIRFDLFPFCALQHCRKS